MKHFSMCAERLTKTAKSSVFRPRYELETSRIEGRNVNPSVKTFGLHTLSVPALCRTTQLATCEAPSKAKQLNVCVCGAEHLQRHCAVQGAEHVTSSIKTSA